jgi:competence protein ComEC
LIDDCCRRSGIEAILGGWIALTIVSLLTVAASAAWKANRSAWPRISPIAVIVLVMSIFGINHHWQDLCYERSTLLSMIGQQPSAAIIEGTVSSTPTLQPNPFAMRAARSRRGQPQTSPWNTSMVIAIDQFQVGQQMQPVDGFVQVSIGDSCDHLRPGDRVRVYGTIVRADLPTNPGSHDWIASDRRRNIHGRLHVSTGDQIELVAQGSGSDLAHRLIASIAIGGREVLLEQLGQVSGPLAVALVIGQRNFVDPTTRDQLLMTGTAHLLSVSGMHLAIVVTLATFLATVLRFPLTWKIVFTIVVCVFYTAITGGRPPVMRAAILVATFTVAMWMRRPSQPINTLSLAGLLLIFLNPENLFSVGVQLSFLAVATLLLASGRLIRQSQSKGIDMALDNEAKLAALAESSRSRSVYYVRVLVRIIRSLLWLSLCVTAVAAPLVWYQFHVVSLISVVTNVILGPLLFVALGTGLVTVICGLIHPLVAWPAAALCHASISIMQGIITVAASVPLGHAWLPAPPAAWVIVFYVGLATTLLMGRTVAARQVRMSWIAIWMAIAFGLATRPAELPESCVELTFVDVGHGTCVVVRAGDETWLYDCGRLGNDAGNSRGIDQVLWSQGARHLQGISLSHADSDHFNALPAILQRFRVDQIVTPPGMLSEPEAALKPIVDAIDHHGIPTRHVSAGEVIEVGGVSLRTLHPPPVRIPGSDNANSLVLRLDHAGRVVLLPGDLEPPGTDVLVRQNRPTPGGVMMAPHHGSLAMDAEVMLQWARPSETIVSGGRLAKRPEVTEMLAGRGSRVHVTAHSGAIRVRISGNGQIEVRSWRESPW